MPSSLPEVETYASLLVLLLLIDSKHWPEVWLVAFISWVPVPCASRAANRVRRAKFDLRSSSVLAGD